MIGSRREIRKKRPNMSLEEFSRDNEIAQLRRFKKYFDELYGEGLQVTNWHTNGDTEMFDTFYEAAQEYMLPPPVDVKIVIDIDDVINNLCECWCDWLSNQYGLSVTYKDVTNWDICSFFPELSKEQVFEPLSKAEFWDCVRPKEGAVEYIEKLVDYGYQVYLCTATDYRNVQMKYEKVIQRYFPFIKWEQIIVTSRKQMIKANVLIDDNINNLVGGDYLKLLMSAPHNQDVDTIMCRVYRVDNWEEIYNTIQGLYGVQEWKTKEKSF